jgi:hypothetical protein
MRHGLLAAGLVLAAGAAQAEGLADCRSAAFVKVLAMKPNYSFDCVEIARVSPPVDGGRWTLRVLRNAASGPQVDGFGQAALAAAERAYIAFEPYVTGLGLRYGNVTMVLGDPVETDLDFGDDGHGHATAVANARSGSLPNECLVSVNLAHIAAQSADYFDNVVAHELFHCVQYWSFPAYANATGGADRWWVESTANLFGNIASYDPSGTEHDAVRFLTSIHKTPLTRQAYKGEMFFAFLLQKGLPTLDAFFRAVPGAATEEAQQKAMEQALGVELLQEFAVAAVDGKIALPSGQTYLAAALPEAEFVTDTVDLPTATQPFTIEMRQFSFVKAEFAAADGKLFRVREAEGDVWGEFPTEIKPKDCAVPVDLLATRFVTTKPKDTVGIPITVMKMQDCVTCTALPKMDQCLVGTWLLNRNDHLSWLQKQAVDMADVRFTSVGGDIFLEISSDGTAQWIMDGFQVGAVYEPAELKMFDTQIEIDVKANAVLTGAWSTDDQGGMNYCGRGASGDYTSNVRIPGLQEDTVSLEAPVEDMYLSYTCGSQSAKMTYAGPAPIPGEFPEWRLDRVK